MKAVLWMNYANTPKYAEVKIPYQFIQTVIGDFDITFELFKREGDYCFYKETRREEVNSGGEIGEKQSSSN